MSARPVTQVSSCRLTDGDAGLQHDDGWWCCVVGGGEVDSQHDGWWCCMVGCGGLGSRTMGGCVLWLCVEGCGVGIGGWFVLCGRVRRNAV